MMRPNRRGQHLGSIHCHPWNPVMTERVLSFTPKSRWETMAEDLKFKADWSWWINVPICQAGTICQVERRLSSRQPHPFRKGEGRKVLNVSLSNDSDNAIFRRPDSTKGFQVLIPRLHVHTYYGKLPVGNPSSEACRGMVGCGIHYLPIDWKDHSRQTGLLKKSRWKHCFHWLLGHSAQYQHFTPLTVTLVKKATSLIAMVTTKSLTKDCQKGVLILGWTDFF